MADTAIGSDDRTKQRLDEGRELRSEVSRGAHAEWDAPPGRADPVAILERQAETRMPDLVPIRYGRMAVSPFTFFRGAAAIMAADLSRTAATGLRVQACGDAHLSNFGVFAAPDRRLVFDLNDFDETLPAPFEWDLKRLAASLVVAARDNGFDQRAQRASAHAAAVAYVNVTSNFATRPFLEVWYSRIDVDEVLAAFDQKATKRASSRLHAEAAKAEGRTSLSALKRFAERTERGFRIKPSPPIVVPVPIGERDEADELIHAALDDYASTLAAERRIVLAHYELADVAMKVVGVGSVGTLSFMVLLMGERDDDPLFLQFKEAQASVLEPFAGASLSASEGQRVVDGQRILQAASDSLLGWCVGRGAAARHFYIRQLRDKKGSANVATMTPGGLAEYGRLCGGCLARAHARSGDIARRAGYMGSGKKFAEAIEQFAVAYADQNAIDYEAFGEAQREGRIVAERDV